MSRMALRSYERIVRVRKQDIRSVTARNSCDDMSQTIGSVMVECKDNGVGVVKCPSYDDVDQGTEAAQASVIGTVASLK